MGRGSKLFVYDNGDHEAGVPPTKIVLDLDDTALEDFTEEERMRMKDAFIEFLDKFVLLYNIGIQIWFSDECPVCYTRLVNDECPNEYCWNSRFFRREKLEEEVFKK